MTTRASSGSSSPDRDRRSAPHAPAARSTICDRAVQTTTPSASSRSITIVTNPFPPLDPDRLDARADGELLALVERAPERVGLRAVHDPGEVEIEVPVGDDLRERGELRRGHEGWRNPLGLIPKTAIGRRRHAAGRRRTGLQGRSFLRRRDSSSSGFLHLLSPRWGTQKWLLSLHGRLHTPAYHPQMARTGPDGDALALQRSHHRHHRRRSPLVRGGAADRARQGTRPQRHRGRGRGDDAVRGDDPMTNRTWS